MLANRIGIVRHVALSALLIFLSLALGLAVLEAGSRVFVTAIATKGKLFRPDVQLGWTPLPHLDLVRRNANGVLWQIRTDASGIRGPSVWREGDHTRLLILGDSFAFGEGVDLAERFDTILGERISSLSVVNLGVMGYGPDQQLIGARRWKKTLRRGDALLLLTYGNDFYDLARTRHAGRSKPWIEAVDGRLREHAPATDVFDLLRDRSYVFTLLLRSFAGLRQSEHTKDRLEDAGELYRRWVLQETDGLVARGVVVVIAHHGDAVFELPFDVDAMFARTCPAVSGCLALDEALAEHPRDEVFLDDGHWAAGGHRIAAEAIAAYLQGLPGFGVGADPPERRPAPVLGRGEDPAASTGAL